MLGRVEQLKVRVKELEQQLQESAREVSRGPWLHSSPGRAQASRGASVRPL